MRYYVYILYSPSKGKYYVGSCEDMSVRLLQHNAGRNKSTKHGVPWELRKTEDYAMRSEAVKREFFIKSMKSRKFIEAVVAGER